MKARQAETLAEAEASFAIPEGLRQQEGDSEAERERKRKKVKALKVSRHPSISTSTSITPEIRPYVASSLYLLEEAIRSG